MGSDLKQIAEKLKDAVHKVDKQEEMSYSLKAQLIYAFNGTGKTRLSREFKDLIVPQNGDNDTQETRNKILGQEGNVGGKTGNETKAGHCFFGFFERDVRNLVTVAL